TEILLDNYDPNQDFTEVCIFDFGTKIIVEFFRGRNSEIRLMDISKRDYLFNQQLSCERIRILGGEMHDHCVLWQTECERWLASHGIFPNDNLKTFKISKNFVRKYTKDSGIILEESDYIDLNQKRQKRQKCVESFNKDWKYR
ncbi:MAG: hypothetical protein RLZZ435_1474, partial [Cyanobacteriota bacterium]